MLIVLLDEPGLFIYATPEDAIHDIEPIDAEKEIRAVFDNDCIPYQVEWLRPNKYSKFGSISSMEPGAYRLVPVGKPDPQRLIDLLERHLPFTDYETETIRELEILLLSLRGR